MTDSKKTRPAFQPITIDPIDERLEARAAQRGVPTLVSPELGERSTAARAKPEPQPLAEAPIVTSPPAQPTPRLHGRRKAINLQVPDYVWRELKRISADRMTTVRHVIMTALRAQGVHINEVDMIEDGRRDR